MTGAVLVTGASGNVGVEVLARLSARGEPVKAAFRRCGAGQPAGVDCVELDFEKPETFAGALAGVDRVFLMRPPHMDDPKAFRPFIDAMTHAGIRQVVFLSVQGAGQNVFVPHHGIETLLKKSGLAWTFLRPSFFMQNLSTTHCAEIRDRDEIFVPAGNGRTNFVDVGDVAEAAVVCLTQPGHENRAYEITGSEALTYTQVARILSEACGRTISYAKPSGREFSERMKAEGRADDMVRVMRSIYTIARIGMAAGTTDTFERLTGRSPKTLEEWTRETAACWR